MMRIIGGELQNLIQCNITVWKFSYYRLSGSCNGYVQLNSRRSEVDYFVQAGHGACLEVDWDPTLADACLAAL